MRKILSLMPLVGFLLLLSSTSMAQCTAPGWASLNGGVTGGGSATPTVVTNYTELKGALTSLTVKVVHVSGTIVIPSGGRIFLQDQSNKTIYGLPGSKLVSNDLTKDGSGILYIKRCSNILFRNMTLEGPGAYDTDGWDNMTIDNSTNVWVDHCEFQDGMDGNFDIKNAADYISVTWCKFIYNKAPIPGGPGGSNDHRFSDLFGSGDAATTDRGKLRVTMQNCWWAQGCKARMPRVRYGKVHIVNSLFSSTVAAQCIMAGFESDLLVERNVFENVKSPIDKMDGTFTAITTRGNIFTNTVGDTTGRGTAFTPPYILPAIPAVNVKSKVMAGAGATLTSPSCSTVTTASARSIGVESEQPAYREQALSVSPNPAKDNATITIALNKGEQAAVMIYDGQGNLVDTFSTHKATVTGTQQVNYAIGSKRAGIYTVIVINSKGTKTTFKLLVE